MLKPQWVAAVICVLAAALVRAQGMPVSTQPAPPAATRPSRIDPVLWDRLRAVDQRVASIRDLSADFEQLKATPMLRKPLVSKGTVRVAGSTVRWDTTKPRPSTILIQTGEIRFYYPDQDSLEIYDVDQRLANLAASPLMRLDQVLAWFELEPLDASSLNPELPPGSDAIGLRLVPREEGLKSRLTDVRVLIDPALAQVTHVQINDPDGERTTIRFSEPRINRGLSAAELELHVPASTRVSRPPEGLTSPPPAPKTP
jgi:outer membrane lipoprotein-sorting protein